MSGPYGDGGPSLLGIVDRAERRDVARNRRAILDAARIVFAQRGVSEAGMDEIARAAGVGKGTLYRRFSNKGLLCQALLDEPARGVQAEVLEIVGGGGSPLQRLARVLQTLARFTDENLDLLYGAHESARGRDREALFDHPARAWQRGTLAGLLTLAEQEGELGPDRDPAYLADALLAPLEPDLFHYQRRVLNFPLDRIIRGLESLAPTPR